MISTLELKKLVKARLKDAETLYKNGRHDGAVYLCGYSLELQLKYRICKTMGWVEFPSTKKDFKGLLSFKIHDLDTLLHLSGKESKIKGSFLADWSVVAKWNPEARYNVIGSATKSTASEMIDSIKNLLKQL